VKPVKGLKLDDLKDLQDLVAQHAEALEPGLRALDSRVALGTATVDLLAVDAEGTLTLVVLGFVADDELLLRALDAYAWCQEYPDELRRLHPLAQATAGEPPRVMIIAEELPETFLRKTRHLKFRRLDFFQFHFGLSFKPVGPSRGEESGRAAPPPRRPELAPRLDAPTREASGRAPAGGSPRRPEPRQPGPRLDVSRLDASRLEAPRPDPLRLESRGDGAATAGPRAESARPFLPAGPRPANGRVLTPATEAPAPAPSRTAGEETPAASWERTAPDGRREVDDWKVSVVREYLQREFPTTVIYDFYAHDRGVQMFHLQDNLGAVVHTAAVAEDLLADLSEADLRAFLDKHRLARVLRQAGQAPVSVTRSGLKIERA
jgi:hypothetical protein